MYLNHLSLCSGIGGLDLAAEWEGFRTVAQCEIDDYASRVLSKNFKGVPNLHDIRTVTNRRLAELGIHADELTVISAGFPCQPYSLAGKGRGDRDERDLWGEVARVLKELRPRWFVGENTPGLFARENQRYFRRILRDLAALGYRVGWGIWGAVDVGAPHKRDRVFILAHANGERRGVLGTDKRTSCGALGESEAETPFRTSGVYGSARGGVFYTGDVSDAMRERGVDERIKIVATENGKPTFGNAKQLCGDVSDADRCRQQERRAQRLSSVQPSQIHSPLSHATGDELGVHGSTDEIESVGESGHDRRGGAERYASWEWWQAEPDVGRVAHGVSARVDKLRCLGNAVVPYQALPIFEAIAEYELSGE